MLVEKTVRTNSQPDKDLGLRLTRKSRKKKINVEISTRNVRRVLQIEKMIESRRYEDEEELIIVGIKNRRQ